MANQMFLAGCNELRPPICCLLSYISLPRPVSKPRYAASEIQLQLQSSLIGINDQDLLLKDTDF